MCDLAASKRLSFLYVLKIISFGLSSLHVPCTDTHTHLFFGGPSRQLRPAFNMFNEAP